MVEHNAKLPTGGLTVGQVCRRIPGARGGAGVCPSTVSRWITVGCPARSGVRVKLKATRAGGRWLIDPDDLQAFFDALGSPTTTTTAPTRTDRQRKQAAERAASELARRGA